uniref:DUF2179 domain-containing protein n=1 Tax=uncultured bacterium fosmid pJB154B8_contig I TaxID=1478049 RepID=A0A0H3U8E9_9BACT|nr:hypothetical protein [uncultured bacterium fosmid pJB154B8_contig I]
MNKFSQRIEKRAFMILVKDYFFIFCGILLYSVGYNAFILPEKFVMGGVSGVASLLYYAFGLPPAFMIMLINAALLLIAFKALSKQFTIRTIVGVSMLSALVALFQWVFTVFPIITPGEDRFMHLVIGALMGGAGLGLVFAHNGSTGGTDIVVALINKHSNMSIGRALQLVDICVICSSYVLFQSVEVIVYGIVYTLIASYALDYVVNGSRQTVQFLIISKRYEIIADAINNDMQRGVTILNGEGWYSKKPVMVVMVLARKYESQYVFNIIKSIDPNAMVSQSFCQGVFGEGFDKIK